MDSRFRRVILTVLAVAAAGAVAGSGLTAAVSRMGAVVLPARAAAHPTYVDVTAQYSADRGWRAAPDGTATVSNGEDLSSGTGAVGRSTSAAVPAVSGAPGSQPSVTSGLVNGPAGLVDGLAPLRSELGGVGLLATQGCASSACGVAGCGFLAPGCALLDCGLLTPACGLGFPVSLGSFGGCGSFDALCGLGGCGILGSRCGFDECGGGCFRHERDLFRFDRRLHIVIDIDRDRFHGRGWSRR
jgi:hypothetical protein